MDEEELGELDNRLALDYQIGDDFKDRVSIGQPPLPNTAHTERCNQIIPHAVDYFTGRALEWDADEWESGEEDDSEDDYDEGDEGEDDEDDDVCTFKPRASHIKFTQF